MSEVISECVNENDQDDAKDNAAVEMINRGSDYADYEIKDTSTGSIVSHTRVVFLAE